MIVAVGAATVLYGCGSLAPSSEGPQVIETDARKTAGPVDPMAPTPRSKRVKVPDSVDATGSKDVSTALQSFINGVPDGSTVSFKAGGTYRLGKTIRISGRRDLTLEGNGARLNLTGTSGNQDSIGIQVRDGSVGTTIRNFTMVGNNSKAGTSAACCSREAQHGIALYSATDTLIEDVDISRVWGDCVYVNAAVVPGGTWSDGVTFRDSTCRLTGRHGVGIIRGSDIRIEGNVFDDIGFDVVDIEPGASDAGANGVLIQNNDIGTFGLTAQWDAWLLAACGKSGSVVRDVTLTGNTIEGNRVGWVSKDGSNTMKALHVKVCGTGTTREAFTVTNNVARATVKGPASYFTDVRGVTFTGNTQPLSSGEQATFPGSTNVTYRR